MVVETSGALLAAELRRWRNARRLSQVELSLRCGTTQRHISYLEQGRSRPGRTMLLRLAESLAIPLRDRNALLLVAGYAPVFPESGLDDDALRPALGALTVILDGHLPYPAMVVGPTGELVAANVATDILFAGSAARLLTPPVNVARLALHPEGMSPRVGNLAEWGRHVVDALRSQALLRPGRGHDDLVDELESYLPPAVPGPDHLGFAVPLQLRWHEHDLLLVTTLTSFATAVDVTLSELHIGAFLPADEATARILQDRAQDLSPNGGLSLSLLGRPIAGAQVEANSVR